MIKYIYSIFSCMYIYLMPVDFANVLSTLEELNAHPCFVDIYKILFLFTLVH